MPLLLAIDGGHKQIVELLLDKGADPNHMTDGLTPVFFKAIDQPEILEILFDRGANPRLKAVTDISSHRFRASIFLHELVARNISTMELLQYLFSVGEFS